MRLAAWISVVLFASSAFSQTPTQLKTHGADAIWEPPDWMIPENVKPTVPKELLSTIRVSNFEIVLEKTSMEDVQRHLGGQFGRRGDASEGLRWLCFHGADAVGAWVLWLEDNEIDGSSIGSFQWQRLNKHGDFDSRCHTLGKATVELPSSLRLGARLSEVLKSLGPPSSKEGEKLIYFHQHEAGGTRDDPFISSNTVVVHSRNGRVWKIQASKTTSD